MSTTTLHGWRLSKLDFIIYLLQTDPETIDFFVNIPREINDLG